MISLNFAFIGIIPLVQSSWQYDVRFEDYKLLHNALKYALKICVLLLVCRIRVIAVIYMRSIALLLIFLAW